MYFDPLDVKSVRSLSLIDAPKAPFELRRRPKNTAGEMGEHHERTDKGDDAVRTLAHLHRPICQLVDEARHVRQLFRQQPRIREGEEFPVGRPALFVLFSVWQFKIHFVLSFQQPNR